jgi:hypothetical protein
LKKEFLRMLSARVLVPPKDLGALAKSILRIISGDNLELQFRKNSTLLYKIKFSSARQIKEITDVYKN